MSDQQINIIGVWMIIEHDSLQIRIMNWNVILAHHAIRIGTTLIPHADPHVKQDEIKRGGLVV